MSSSSIIRPGPSTARESPAARPTAPRPSRRRWGRRREGVHGISFTVPFLVAFLLFMVAPLGYAIYTSLYTSRLIGGTTYSGLANYSQTLSSGDFWSGVVRTVIYAVIQIPIMLAIAFFFATIFDLGLVKGGRVFRAIFFVPFAVPAVVGSVMWSFMLEPQFGPFTRLAEALGLGRVNFFSSSLVLLSIILIVIWEWTGYNMVILYTALKSVPRDVVESAILDGAPLHTIVLRVKLPIVRPAIVMLLFLNTIGALQLFTEPLILSYFQNSAITIDYTPALYIYWTAVGGGQYNLAAAAAVVLGLVIVVISTASLIFRRGKGEAS